MKTIFSNNSFVIIIFALLLSCNGSNQQSTNQSAEIVSANFEIKGMSCAMGCAKMIEKKLAATPGVNFIEVNFENENAQIQFDQSQIKQENLKEILESLHGGDTYFMGNFEVVNAATKSSVNSEDAKSEKADLQKQTSFKKIQFPSIFELIKKFLPVT